MTAQESKNNKPKTTPGVFKKNHLQYNLHGLRVSGDDDELRDIPSDGLHDLVGCFLELLPAVCV